MADGKERQVKRDSDANSSKPKLDERALAYHRLPIPGKLEIAPTKPLATQQDLALAYSPGVADACTAIAEDPEQVANLTARANLVAVVTNGSAVLGLGNIGPSASKPVMEGKAVLFKKFSGIDVFDIEIDESDPEKFVDVVASLEPTFGGINLEDIKAPECFVIERALRERMKIPVFHDDQHGTAIIVAAAVTNALELTGRSIDTVKLVASGAGAAALACLDLLVSMGMKKENITVTDIVGVVYPERNELMDEYKARYARDTEARTLGEVIGGADVFLGLSAGGVLKPEMVTAMADKPIILALANPYPEISPDKARKARPDAIIATGRSDYPNQVNNVLCFPFIFRGALDAGATEINDAMKQAAVAAIASLAKMDPSAEVTQAYGGDPVQFGPDKLIPKPFDPRLIIQVPIAVAKAAMESGVATRPIEDFQAYQQRLTQFVFRSGLLMKPMFDSARRANKRLVYAEGEEHRVLQAAQQAIDEGLARPILIGRANVIEQRIRRLGLRMKSGQDFELVNILKDARYRQYWQEYHRVLGRRGVTPDIAKSVIRSNATAVAAMMLRQGDADAMLCGTVGKYGDHLREIDYLVGKKPGTREYSALAGLILTQGTFFIGDTHVTASPTAEDVAEMALLAADELRALGITPKVALLSRSNFGSNLDSNGEGGKMAKAAAILHETAPDLEVEGEMQADAALSERIRLNAFPESALKGAANLLVMPNVDAANIAFNLLKVLGSGVSLGPILVGAAGSAHVVTQSITVRGLVNMTALACARADSEAGARLRQ